MHLLPQDERFLQHALGLAAAAQGLASPNPTVGCVLVRDNEVIGEGAHFYDNRDHAEIAALKQAAAHRENVRGATVYVTLEPCSHHGRTGPCSAALAAAGTTRCVVATVDPNPLVRGRGIEKMRAAGIEVALAEAVSTLAHQARRLNDAFAFSIQHGRPFVTLKAAVSIDGKLAPPPPARTSQTPFWLTGEAARADVQQLRHAADAILTGVGTVFADDPLLTDRTGLPRRRPLLRVVLDSALRIPLDSQLVRSARGDVLLICAMDAPAGAEEQLRSRGVDVLRVANQGGRLGLPEVFAKLAQRQILSLLAEGGPALNGSLLREGLADEVVLYYADIELGRDALPFAEGIASPYVLQQQLTGVQRAVFPHGPSEDVRISGHLHDPWEDIA